MFLKRPAALVAFIWYRVFLAGALALFGVGLSGSHGLLFDYLPVKLTPILRFGFLVVCTHLVGSTFMVSGQVYRRAVWLATRDL